MTRNKKHLLLWKQFVTPSPYRSQTLQGPDTLLPMPPFPGLRIGALVVKTVLIMQGDQNENIVVYNDVTVTHGKTLLKKGWKPIDAT